LGGRKSIEREHTVEDGEEKGRMFRRRRRKVHWSFRASDEKNGAFVGKGGSSAVGTLRGGKVNLF